MQRSQQVANKRSPHAHPLAGRACPPTMMNTNDDGDGDGDGDGMAAALIARVVDSVDSVLHARRKAARRAVGPFLAPVRALPHRPRSHRTMPWD